MSEQELQEEKDVPIVAYKRAHGKFHISKFFKSRIFLILLCLVLTLSSFFLGMHVDYVTRFKTLKDYELLTSVIKYVNENYYEDLDSDTLIYYACKGVVDNLDPYSMIYVESDSEQDNVGYFGMEMSYGVNGQFRVMWVNEDSPAEKAGIKVGDYIVSVNGKVVEGDFVDYFVALMGNKKIGDSVTLKVKSELNGELREVIMVAEQKSTQTVRVVNDFSSLPGSLSVPSSVGYIKFTSFDDASLKSLTNAISEFKSAGKTKLILDLRDNTGGDGLVLQKIAKYFLKPSSNGEEKVVMRLKKSDGAFVDYKTSGDGEYIFKDISDGKIIVLTNGNTASASEALIGAMVLDGGVELVGSTTYGKGVGQSTRPFPSATSPLFNLKLTIGKYYFAGDVSAYVSGASGYTDCIEGVGFTPKAENIVYSGRTNALMEDPVMQKALAILTNG